MLVFCLSIDSYYWLIDNDNRLDGSLIRNVRWLWLEWTKLLWWLVFVKKRIFNQIWIWLHDRLCFELRLFFWIRIKVFIIPVVITVIFRLFFLFDLGYVMLSDFFKLRRSFYLSFIDSWLFRFFWRLESFLLNWSILIRVFFII